MFREDFRWGAASSAYQTEGTDPAGGCGKNVWDTFTEEGHIQDGTTAAIACDGYHRFHEDVLLMKQFGIQNYRFSLNWSRLIPEGTGKVNEKGIAYYKALLTDLRKNGITPFITLFHWEYPQALEDQGGWLNPDSGKWFAEYAAMVSENFSDDCCFFIPLNEPQCFCGLGNLSGDHAPGKKLQLKETFQLVHNVLKAQGMAVRELRAHAKQNLQIGLAPTCTVPIPETDSPEDIEAARERYFSVPDDPNRWTWNVPWFSDPVILGKYPVEGMQTYREYLPEITDADRELISCSPDFYGQNIYNGYTVRAGKNGKSETVPRKPGYPRTAAGWPITPECLYWGPRFLYERYHKPIYITENGMSCHDVVSLDGKVHDPNRIDFLHRYLSELKRAAEDGADIRGYFHWSLTDNFEWDKGYQERFGLIFIDYETQKRIPKDSASWYRDMMKTNGEMLSRRIDGKNEFV